MPPKDATVAVHAGGPKQQRAHTTPVTDAVDMRGVEADLTTSESGPNQLLTRLVHDATVHQASLTRPASIEHDHTRFSREP